MEAVNDAKDKAEGKTWDKLTEEMSDLELYKAQRKKIKVCPAFHPGTFPIYLA